MEPRRTIGKFTVVKQAGKGSFGTVWAATKEEDGDLFAIKEVRKEQLNEGVFQNLLREVSISKSLLHPNLSHCLFTMESKASFFMVFEFCQGGDLDKHLKATKRLPIADAMAIIRQLRDGFQFLYDHGVLHRDLKPDNVLFVDKAKTHIRIADFGSSKEAIFGSTVIGTPKYMAPEVIAAADRYNYKADIWSFALICWELYFGIAVFPYSLASRKDLEADVRKFSGPKLRFPNEAISPVVGDFFVRCLTLSPEARMDATEFFAHPFFEIESDKASPLQAPSPTKAPKAFRFLADRAAEAAVCETAARETLKWLPESSDTVLSPAVLAAALLLADRALRRCDNILASLEGGQNVYKLEDFDGISKRAGDVEGMLVTIKELKAALVSIIADAKSQLEERIPASSLRDEALEALFKKPSSDARKRLLRLMAEAAETAAPKLLSEDKLTRFRTVFRRVLGLMGQKSK
jgi:serine/threonine-protein kinase ULK/ATG1